MKPTLLITVLLMFASSAQAQSGGRFSMVRSVIAGGGVTAGTGGNFTLSSTVGQSVAGLVSETRFEMRSGFWITPSFLVFSPAKVGNSFSISFETTPGQTYIVEYTDSLLHPNWQPLPTENGDGTVKTVTAVAPGVAIRFYRVRAQ